MMNGLAGKKNNKWYREKSGGGELNELKWIKRTMEDN